jgi:glutathione S-transferase
VRSAARAPAERRIVARQRDKIERGLADFASGGARRCSGDAYTLADIATDARARI